ncbi:MAG: DUF1565 domain-containing protein [bacterium]|nr:DUF1565 domain-containing protein [bacterium]
MASFFEKLLFVPACLLSLGPSALAGNPYYVDAANGSAGGDGTVGNPWLTITQAVGSGQFSSPGNVLIVLPGTYDAALGEVFPIGIPSGMEIDGPADGTAIVERSGANAFELTNPTVGTSIVEGLSFTDLDGGSFAIVIGSSGAGGDVRVVDNLITGRGVDVTGLPDALLIDGNTVYAENNGESHAVIVNHDGTSAAKSIIISNNTVEGGPGLELNLFGSAVVTQASILGNILTGFGNIELAAGGDAQVSDCVISGNTLSNDGPFSFGASISVDAGSAAVMPGPIVSNNVLEDGGTLRFECGYPNAIVSDAVVDNNTLSGGVGIAGGDLSISISHENYGTSLNMVTNFTVSNNVLTGGVATTGMTTAPGAGTLKVGNRYGPRSSGTISGNTVTGAEGIGISFAKTEDEYGTANLDWVIENNTVSGSGAEGLNLYLTHDDTEVTSSTVFATVMVRGNSITDAGSEGVRLEGTFYYHGADLDLTLENNTIQGSTLDGLYADMNVGASYAAGLDLDLSLDGNSIVDSGGHGFRLSVGDAQPSNDINVDVTRNAFKGSGGDGARVVVLADPVSTLNTTRVDYEGNSIQDNTGGALTLLYDYDVLAVNDALEVALGKYNTISDNTSTQDLVLAITGSGAAFTHVSVDAMENWWGTTSLGDIEGRVTHNPDDAMLGTVDFSSPYPDTLSISTTDMISSTGGETVTVTAGALTAFVPYIGSQVPETLVITGDIDSLPVADIVVAPDGKSLTFTAPAGVTNGCDAILTITNPEGQTGSTPICVEGTSNYCVTSPNSVGLGAIMGSTGSTSIANDDFGLVATGMPDNFALFITGTDEASIPFYNGTLCVTPFCRLGPVVVVTGNVATKDLPLSEYPIHGCATPIVGSEFLFQCVYRDMGQTNSSDGLRVTFGL